MGDVPSAPDTTGAPHSPRRGCTPPRPIAHRVCLCVSLCPACFQNPNKQVPCETRARRLAAERRNDVWCCIPALLPLLRVCCRKRSGTLQPLSFRSFLMVAWSHLFANCRHNRVFSSALSSNPEHGTRHGGCYGQPITEGRSSAFGGRCLRAPGVATHSEPSARHRLSALSPACEPARGRDRV